MLGRWRGYDWGLACRDRLRAWVIPPDLAIWHHFYHPPYGGGNQCLLALRRAWGQRGLQIETNHCSIGTTMCLVNSMNFNFEAVRRLKARRGHRLRVVHRLDGPIGAYRGTDAGVDRALLAWNQDVADATIFQSTYSRQAHEAQGFKAVQPVVIPNAVDPAIFYPSVRPSRKGRKLRIISTSWSQHPNKGAATYHWLDRHLDWSRYDYTFIGRLATPCRHIHVLPPVPSNQVAALLRDHDIYLTASWHDPCSNALLEALACGLPAVYAQSGGHPELVGGGGEGFTLPEEIPACLERIRQHSLDYVRAIHMPTLEAVATAYLRVLGVAA